MENACEKYDRYEQGRKTEETHDLLAAVESFATFLSSDRVEVNDDLIEQFVHAENLSGLMVMDSDGHMAAHYDIDGRDPLMLWREELACAPVASMYQGSKVTYSTVVERRGVVLPSVLSRMATALPWHTAHLFPIQRTTIHMP